MRRLPKSILLLPLACLVLSGCGPHLKKLGVCSSGKYRYANPQGVSLPSLDVPTLDEVSGRAPPLAAPQGDPPTPVWDRGSPPPAPAPDASAPVASPPKPGAMLLPPPGSAVFGSC